MGDPPVEVGGTQLMTAWPTPGVAVTVIGEPGVVTGTTLVESDEAGPVPAAFVATTEKR